MMTACNSSGTNRLLDRVRHQDEPAFAELFARHRERLRKMVRLRLDRRLRGRFDSSTVLRQVEHNAWRRIGEYRADQTSSPAAPSSRAAGDATGSFFLWLRLLTGQVIQALHRDHLETQAWEELSLYRGALPEVNSVALAAQLMGHRDPSQTTTRADMLLRLQDALNSMDALDREVLALCHFEELSDEETAAVLGISKAAATERYVQALKRLKEILKSIPGFLT
jgi:RNA polymerase sigma-70 factor (ECF subfamily)